MLKEGGVAADRKVLYPVYYKVLAFVVLSSIDLWNSIICLNSTSRYSPCSLNSSTAILKTIRQLNGDEMLY